MDRKDLWGEMNLIIRPAWMVLVAVGGTWLGVAQLSIAPWHHWSVIWVVGFGAAAYGGYQASRAIADRVRLARWLDADDPKAGARLEDAETWAKRLPRWYQTRFYERRAHLRRAGWEKG